MDRQLRGKIAANFSVALIFGLALFLFGCGGGGGTKEPVPVIINLNNSTQPSGSVSLPIEIDGTGYQSAPGQVIFAQGSITANVTPSTGGWSGTGIVVDVPSGSSSTQFTVPGTVAVSVKTSGGTSNSINLTLVQQVNFNVNNVTWTTTTALLKPESGLAAVAVPSNSKSSAFVVLAGGYDGTNDLNTVLTNTIAQNGTLGTWTTSTNALPSPRAYAGMVEANAGNSLVPAGSQFVYVIGGQQSASDTPGGTATVFMAPVDPTNGSVGAWTQLANSLPVALVGPGVTIADGYVYVVGGLQTTGVPSSAVYSAPVNSDGTLGTWTKAANSYPVTVAFPSVFAFAGNLYAINGDDQNQTSPDNADTGGVTDANLAPIPFGVVGPWTPTAQTIKSRSKQSTWLAFGQIIDAEGTYSGGAGSTGSLELERTTVSSNGTLATWNGITAVNAPGANVYNAAAIVSPVLSTTNAPRFLLFGGEQFLTVNAGYPTNPLSATVYVNSTP